MIFSGTHSQLFRLQNSRATNKKGASIMTIGITGATGQLGRLVIERLKETMPSGSIVALARSPGEGAGLGVAVRQAYYDQPDSLAAALRGVGTLLLISSNEIGRRTIQHRNVINAAKEAGVRRIVYTSLLHADSSPLSLAEEHRETELALAASSIPCTILRNGWYSENYTGLIPGALARGAWLGCAGEGRISSAARADYADAAVAVLTGAGHEGKVYELAGDDSWTLRDLAAEISRQTGKPIPYRDLMEASYAAALVGERFPEALAKALASFDAAAAKGALFNDRRQLARLIGRRTTPLSVSVARTLRNAA